MPPRPEGMGDDCAVTNLAEQNLWTTDSLIYGCHFDDSVSPENAGSKLLKRSLSDIAAMGGRPGVALLAGMLPGNSSIAWLERFFRGLADCAREYEVRIVGGDLAQSNMEWMTSLSLSGFAKRPLLRTSAKEGDTIWVTGALGGSFPGRHATFTPRMREGIWLGEESDSRHAVIDVTDGLAKDLPAILPPDCAASLDADRIPIHEDAVSLSRHSGKTPLSHAFTDGEDYELLFTVPAETPTEGFLSRWQQNLDTPVHRIGTIIHKNSESRIIDSRTRKPWKVGNGYQHF